MLFHRTHKPPPALETVERASHTSFPGHDLGAGAGWAHRVSDGERSGLVAGVSCTCHSGEISRSHLPFAIAPLFHGFPVAT